MRLVTDSGRSFFLSLSFSSSFLPPFPLLSFSFSLFPSLHSQTHTCSWAVCQSKIVSAIKLNFLHSLLSTRWERDDREWLKKKSHGIFCVRDACVRESNREVTPASQNRSSARMIVTPPTTDVLMRNDVISIKYHKEINKTCDISKIPCINNEQRNAALLWQFLIMLNVSLSIGETLRDEQKAPLFPNRIIAFVSSWTAGELTRGLTLDCSTKKKEKRTEKKYTKIGNAAKWSVACVRVDVVFQPRQRCRANPFSRPAVRGRFLVRIRYGSLRVADSYVDVDNRCWLSVAVCAGRLCPGQLLLTNRNVGHQSWLWQGTCSIVQWTTCLCSGCAYLLRKGDSQPRNRRWWKFAFSEKFSSAQQKEKNTICPSKL